MQLMESHLKENILCYQNNPVTKWMFSNVELIQDRNGNFMPKKSEDKEMRKIDGPATILNCYVSLSKDLDTYMGTR
jgi:phage terminase large subunit-like protein